MESRFDDRLQERIDNLDVFADLVLPEFEQRPRTAVPRPQRTEHQTLLQGPRECARAVVRGGFYMWLVCGVRRWVRDVLIQRLDVVAEEERRAAVDGEPVNEVLYARYSTSYDRHFKRRTCQLIGAPSLNLDLIVCITVSARLWFSCSVDARVPLSSSLFKYLELGDARLGKEWSGH